MNLFNQRIPLAAAILLGCLAALRAAEPPAKQLQPERWLLVVDCSAAMERRAEAVKGVVGELLVSGMNGQMQPGDDLGVWTFNKELYAGVAPMQSWDTTHSNRFAGRVVMFLGQQVYRDKSNLGSVLSELPRLVRESRQLTVVLMSDGTGTFSGTPFDDAINAAYAKHRPALAKTRMPLVTVLRSHQGKYIGQNVSFAPWPIEFPPFPDELQPTNAVAKTNAPALKPVEPIKPIIISGGKKPEAERPAPKPLPVKPLETIAPLPPAATNIIASVEPVPVPQPAVPKPTPTPVETAKVNPGPVAVPVVASAETPRVKDAGVPEPAVAPPTPPTAPIAVAPGDVTARKWPLILGIGCMWGAILAALVLARRARRARATSLITRSFDQDRK